MEQEPKQYTILHAPFLSFFSKPFYQDVAWRWKGTNLLYLFLLLALTWLPLVGRWHWSLSRFLTRESPKLLEQVKPFHLRGGKASIDAPEPYEVRIGGLKQPLVVVDTTGEISSMDDTEAVVLVTETKLHTRNNRNQVQIHDLRGFPDFDLDREDVAGWIDFARRWLLIAAFPVLLLGCYTYRILQALLYGLVGLVFAAGLHTRVTYAACLRLAIVAVTPAIVLNTIKLLAGIRIPMWSWMCLGIAMLYLFLGVKWSAEHPPEPAEYEITEAAPASWQPPS